MDVMKYAQTYSMVIDHDTVLEEYREHVVQGMCIALGRNRSQLTQWMLRKLLSHRSVFQDLISCFSELNAISGSSLAIRNPRNSSECSRILAMRSEPSSTFFPSFSSGDVLQIFLGT